MKILLDTCEFLWLISGDSRLRVQVKEAIQSSENEVFLSVVSHWEVIVKFALGKLPLPMKPEVFIPHQRQIHQIRSLSLSEEAVNKLAHLPTIHRDPFDRMLVCQAQEASLCIATSDPLIRQYPVKVL